MSLARAPLALTLALALALAFLLGACTSTPEESEEKSVKTVEGLPAHEVLPPDHASVEQYNVPLEEAKEIDEAEQYAEEEVEGGERELTIMAQREGTPIIDEEDPDQLCAFATNVFLGVVRKQDAGRAPLMADPALAESDKPEDAKAVLSPQRQYLVAVIEEVKGEVTEVQGATEEGYPLVMLNQEAGNYEEGGPIEVMAGDTLLQEGSHYLFVTAFDEEHSNYNIILLPHGHVAANDEETREELLKSWREDHCQWVPPEGWPDEVEETLPEGEEEPPEEEAPPPASEGTEPEGTEPEDR